MSDPLKNIDHIVVLMMENRSFDHMLGYLKLNGRNDVDGLDGTQSNTYKGKSYTPSRQGKDTFEPDPQHEWESVAEQLQNNNGGFVSNYANEDSKSYRRIMDYYDGTQAPVYDHLAREFCISDRWFASVPGATQPNRVYAMCGHSNGKKNNLSTAQLVLRGWDVKPIFEFLPDGVSWRCYSHDISTLRYLKGYRGIVERIDKINKFFDHAATGTLPNVSWIDPCFYIPNSVYPGPPNDDHPPHDIKNGQNLVRRVYNSLANGPREQFEKTLLVIVYDEHGGFYDHVPPGQWTPEDERSEFRKYGVRVPVFVVSPWVKKGSCVGSGSNQVFDHTSILKTILHRFCTDASGNVPHLSARVAAANDLGLMLTETSPRTDYTPAPPMPFDIAWEDRFVMVDAMVAEQPQKQLRKRRPSELQQSLEALADKVISEGVPPENL